MEIIEMRIGDLIPYENNPRKNYDAVSAVAASIREFGFKVPIIVDKNNVIVAGHTRLKAAKSLGMKTVPVIMADDLTEEQVTAFRLADNKTGELAEWDFSKLEDELAKISEIDMSVFGFELAGEDESFEIEEDEPPAESAKRCEKGDLWQLGDHLLLCGDSTDAGDVERLMGEEEADLMLTDPPYGISVVKSNQVGGGGALHFGGVKNQPVIDSRTYHEVIGDDTTDTAEINYEIAKCYSRNQILFGGNYFTDFLQPSRCWIVWDKQNTGNFADAELAWTSFDKGVKLYHFLWNGLCREGSRKVEGVSRAHPTQKPVGLMANILNDFSESGDLILDCFGGSGSTLIACEQTGRKCRMMEIDPHYCDVILQRWENLTGKKAVKIQ